MFVPDSGSCTILFYREMLTANSDPIAVADAHSQCVDYVVLTSSGNKHPFLQHFPAKELDSHVLFLLEDVTHCQVLVEVTPRLKELQKYMTDLQCSLRTKVQ